MLMRITTFHICTLAIATFTTFGCGTVAQEPETPPSSDIKKKPADRDLTFHPPKERMTKEEWENVKKDFAEHFFIDKSLTTLGFQRHQFPWKDILELRQKHPSNGLYFEYGLRDSNFIPVVSLYRGEPRNFELVPGTSFVSDPSGSVMHAITPADADPLIAEYNRRVWAKRLNGNLEEISTDQRAIEGIWYSWIRLDSLFVDNPQIEETRRMVACCIATQLSLTDQYSCFDKSITEEYRHTLAINVAVDKGNGHEDQVDNEPHTQNFAYRAMDYGSVCPFSCPKKEGISVPLPCP